MVGQSFVSEEDISGKYPDLFRLIAKCAELSDLVFQNIGDHNINQFELSLYQKVLTANYVKDTICLSSLGLLLSRAHTEDSGMLVRKMYELLVNMKYVDEDSENRAKQYCHHPKIRLRDKLRQMARESEDPEAQAEVEALLKKYTSAYEKKKHLYGLDKKERDVHRDFSLLVVGEFDDFLDVCSGEEIGESVAESPLGGAYDKAGTLEYGHDFFRR